MVLGYAIVAASFGPVVALANLPSNLTMSFASARRILDLIDTKPSSVEGDKSFKFGKLELKNVSFGYDDKDILTNINLSLNRGQIAGIYGKSGSGKSTLLKLLLNFESPKEGEVLFNNLKVQEYSREALTNNVILFSQSTYLFQGTIEYNLKIAKPSATDEELKLACEKAGILEYINKTEKGFQTEISALKDNLSSGEKQRIGLARVFLTSAPLLLLDEATSNVDAYNESLILKQLIKEKEDKAIIIISHRKSTLSICDKVYKLEGGKLCSD
jgi:ATP-binding cassette subfamily C protein